MPQRPLPRKALAAVAFLLVLSCTAAVVVPGREPARHVSLVSLRGSFNADIRNMVYEWSPDDLRSPAERRDALFAFMYEGYNSSAWIPQSLFDGNLITQAILGRNETIIRDRIGMVLWPENQVARAYGMAPNPDPSQPLSWTVNCLACHTAEIDGVVYFGAGTKVLDEKALADTVRLVTGAGGRQTLSRDAADHRLAEHAHDVMNRHHHEQLDSLSRARSTAFPASHVEMYVRSHGGAMPNNEQVDRGDVKTPPLWHAAAKWPFGRWYCDGSFHAELPLMASSMELELDQSFDKLVTSVLPVIKHDFRTAIDFIRPPKYPYAIDAKLAEQGRVLFHSEEIGCHRCHGEYDGKGNVQWTGLHEDVGTDRARLDVVSPGFVEAFESSPLAAEGKLARSEGYAATPLTGVWANYPYLHNGSVPTLHHLLGPASERPRVFSVMAARRLDRERVGQKLVATAEYEHMSEAELLDRFGHDRDWYNAGRPGCGNQGHDFWSRIRTDENRRALIEYLKTL
jgi:hypothetical protein